MLEKKGMDGSRKTGGPMRRLAFIGLLTVGVAFLASSGTASAEPTLDRYLPAVELLKGRLIIIGSETMDQLMSGLGGQLKRWYPGSNVVVETEGSEAGF